MKENKQKLEIWGLVEQENSQNISFAFIVLRQKKLPLSVLTEQNTMRNTLGIKSNYTQVHGK